MSRELDPVRIVITAADVMLGDVFTVDSVLLEDGDEVLVAIPGSTENGPYVVVEDAPWFRREDWNQAGQMLPHSHVTVLEGEINRGSSWYFANPQPPTLGVTVLNWEQRDYGTTVTGGNMLSIDPATGQLVREETGVDPGDYTSPTMSINEFGDVVAAEPGTVPVTFIEGLDLSYTGSNNFTVRSGAAWIPGEQIVLDMPDDFPKIGNVFAPNTTYYVYFYRNVSSADFEFSSQVPASPYRGVASVKGGPNNTTPDADPDDTRRTLGTFQTDGSANVMSTTVKNIGSQGAASDTQQGMIEIATAAEVQAGIDSFRAVTPAGLSARTANESRSGLVEIATQLETNAGVDDTRVVTPAKLGGRIASETSSGFVELATQAETNAGVDDQRAVTPLKMAGRVPTETSSGFAEIATLAEAQAGTDDLRYITPLKLAGRTATETRAGLAEIATQTEVNAGVDDTRFVTPLKLDASIATTTRRGVVELATQAEVDAGIDPDRAVAPSRLAARLQDVGAMIGEMKMWAGSPSVDPGGGKWLLCDGREVSRTTYAALYSVVGVNWGSGNGSTTFNLPDMRGRSPIGYNSTSLPNGRDTARTDRVRGDEEGTETVILTDGHLSAHNHGSPRTTDNPGGHTHRMEANREGNTTATGSFLRVVELKGAGSHTANTDISGGHSHDVSIANTGSDTAHNNMHPVNTVNFIIRALP